MWQSVMRQYDVTERDVTEYEVKDTFDCRCQVRLHADELFDVIFPLLVVYTPDIIRRLGLRCRVVG